jgi:hypothetical protein
VQEGETSRYGKYVHSLVAESRGIATLQKRVALGVVHQCAPLQIHRFDKTLRGHVLEMEELTNLGQRG